MRNKLITGLFITIGCYTAQAQSDTLKRTSHYFNTFTAGSLIGCGQCNNGKDFTFSFTTQHGIAFKSGIRLSVGTGLDVYDSWRMIPLVLGITLDKGDKPKGIYFHINGGHAFGRALLINEYERQFLYQRGGFTINPMLGFRIGNEKVRLYMQTGYKFQNAYYRLDYSETYSYSRNYEIERVIVQMGFGFN